MKLVKPILFLMVLASSCQTEQPESIHAGPCQTDHVQAGRSVDQSFPEFWAAFRQAVITNDSATIFSLTKFPLETRGPMDTDPVVKYPKETFRKILPLFLGLQSGVSEGTEFDLIRSTIAPSPDDYSKESANIGNSVFSFADGHWKLTFVYLHPPVLEEIRKNHW